MLNLASISAGSVNPERQRTSRRQPFGRFVVALAGCSRGNAVFNNPPAVMRQARVHHELLTGCKPPQLINE